eukprot:TRINITY_DN2597_c0_g1_i1.p1 TRINITY_DN2597_c0_g1~~TRINITY_DN2597_c0_g1_i1.p1  ORF type:complete len:503 (-),score=121.10 TRINITY_DN2597_c0_g1_i1:115-1623(-)
MGIINFLLSLIVLGAVTIILLIMYVKKRVSRIYNIETKQPLTFDVWSNVQKMKFFLSLDKKESPRDRFFKDWQRNPRVDISFAPLPGSIAVAISHPEDIKKILASPDFDKPEKIFATHGVGALVLGQSLVFASGKDGWNHRKALNPAFTFSKVKNLVKPFVNITQTFIDIVEEHRKKNSEVNIATLLKYLTFDVIGITAFGYDFKSLSEDTQQKKDLDHTFRTTSGAPAFFDTLSKGLYSKLPLASVKETHRAFNSSRKLVLDVINKRLEERKSGVYNQNDLLDLILDAAAQDDAEFKLTTTQMISDMFLFFIAGHETSAGILTSAVYYLGKNKKVLEEATKEVDKVLGKGQLPSAENINEFPFVQAVLRETLRMRPPINSAGFRVALKDCVIAKHFVPQGTIILLPNYRAHYSEEFWENPLEWNPHRWIGEGSQKNQIFAFSSGTRICIGHKFSMTEMTVIMAMLLQKYTWTLPEDYVYRDDPASITTTPAGGLPVRLTIR